MSNLDRTLKELKILFLELGTKVQELLQLSTTAFLDDQVNNIQLIFDKDKEIDDMEIRVEEECLKTLALYQPVARDLRFIVSILKINNDLERIGDLSVNIIKPLKSGSYIKEYAHSYFSEMVEKVTYMFQQSLDAFLEQDSQLALKICKLDDEVDDLKNKMRIKVITDIQKDPEKSEKLLNMFLNARHLERIADLSTNIAEDVIYLNEGKIIRHQHMTI